VRQALPVSERRVCRALAQPRSTQGYQGQRADEEELLTERVIALASQYGRYGYRRITALLYSERWRVNHKRVERIWCQEGVQVPRKQPKRGRYGLTMAPACVYALSMPVMSGATTHGGQNSRRTSFSDPEHHRRIDARMPSDAGRPAP